MLDHLLNTKVFTKLKEVLDAKFDSTDFKTFVALLKKVNSLRNVRPRTNYVKAIITTLKFTQEEGEFDMNPDLLCFKNGVYDLGLDQFRAGRKGDFCSQVVPYEWSESSAEDTEHLMEFIDKIMPPQRRERLLTNLVNYTFCIGRQVVGVCSHLDRERQMGRIRSSLGCCRVREVKTHIIIIVPLS